MTRGGGVPYTAAPNRDVRERQAGMRSRHVSVVVDLDSVRSSAEQIKRQTGVDLIAVVKSDAYGLGAVRVADALCGVADDLAYFSIDEAREVGKPGLLIGPPPLDPAECAELRVRPSVGTREQARRFAGLPCAVNVDTGMQRFGCAPEELDELIDRSIVSEITTHAATQAAAEQFKRIVGDRPFRRHAASSSLLNCPTAWLDAVRPGVALYRGAVRVASRLYCVRATRGAVGYTGFECPRVGVILAGYSNGLRPTPVLINGRRQQILEVGMNTAFVSVDAADAAEDEVVLLGDGLTEMELAAHLRVREHEILCRYTGLGARRHARRGESVVTPIADGTPASAAALPGT